ncbi:MAG: arginine--tRNA ligase [Thermoleophilia bacterium]|nr:arginine--tRNA ligase [Thermoleophilia bacterium]
MRRLAEPLEAAARAVAGDGAVEVELERPADPAHGDFATTVALRLAPQLRRAPRDVARELAERADFGPLVDDVSVAGPGFLNLRVAASWYGEALGELLAAGGSYAAGSAASPERVQVELVSANPTGPLTVASARNAAYGDSVARLLELAGHEVEREYYVNDLGTQIDLFRESVAARARGEEPPAGGYLGDYVAAIGARGGDPVERMVQAIRDTLERFRVHVDRWAFQSEVERDLDAALAELDLYEGDGARWLRTTAWGDDKDRVVIRSDGRPTYFAADAAYMRSKLARGFERLIYVLGADHHGYVARLKALAAAYGYDPDRVEVLIYQLVHLKEGGEARKASKRRGDVVFLDELIDEIGVDAARWYLVMRGHEQTVEIDVDLAREKSEKNQVYYVQYAHARICGILRNAGGARPAAVPPRGLAGEERELVKRLTELPAVVAEATVRRAPHAIPVYAVRLADDFHRFYHHHRVLGSGETEPFRLGLCAATRDSIARCLDLVGVDAPERM